MDAFKEFLKPEIIWFLVGLALFIMEYDEDDKKISNSTTYYYLNGALYKETSLDTRRRISVDGYIFVEMDKKDYQEEE